MKNYITYRTIYNRAAHFYNLHAQFRHYHNLPHATNVVKYCAIIIQGPVGLVLKMAAMWHDAIYYPGCPGNEEASARALYLEAKAVGEENNHIIQEAMGLIRLTTVEQHLTTERVDGLLAVLLDADLAGLAADFATFSRAQDAILLENYIRPEDIELSRVKCAGFLMKFLVARPFIYHTDKARELYEEAAKNNIIEYCQQYYPNFNDHLINMKNDHEREYGRTNNETV